MKKIIKVILIFTLSYSCSSINNESKEFYDGKNTIKHGIKQMAPTHTVKHLPRDIAGEKRGKVVYEQNCLSCHGPTATGNGPSGKDLDTKPADLVSLAKKVPNFRFFMLISKWQGSMPGSKSLLSEQEMRDVEKYIVSLARE